MTTADPALRAPAWDAMARVAARKGDFARALEFTQEQAFTRVLRITTICHPSPGAYMPPRRNCECRMRDFDVSEQGHCLGGSVQFSVGQPLN